MTQLDLFEETLSKKIQRIERWVHRLQKELWWLKEVHNMSKKAEKVDTSKKSGVQVDMFSA